MFKYDYICVYARTLNLDFSVVWNKDFDALYF